MEDLSDEVIDQFEEEEASIRAEMKWKDVAITFIIQLVLILVTGILMARNGNDMMFPIFYLILSLFAFLIYILALRHRYYLKHGLLLCLVNYLSAVLSFLTIGFVTTAVLSELRRFNILVERLPDLVFPLIVANLIPSLLFTWLILRKNTKSVNNG